MLDSAGSCGLYITPSASQLLSQSPKYPSRSFGCCSLSGQLLNLGQLARSTSQLVHGDPMLQLREHQSGPLSGPKLRSRHPTGTCPKNNSYAFVIRLTFQPSILVYIYSSFEQGKAIHDSLFFVLSSFLSTHQAVMSSTSASPKVLDLVSCPTEASSGAPPSLFMISGSTSFRKPST